MDARGTSSTVSSPISFVSSRRRNRSTLILRLLLVLGCLLVAGCDSDSIHSAQTFFPGSERTAWDSCDKFNSATDEITICASTAILAGHTQPSYNIRFNIPNSDHVKIAVFDSHAALVKVLFDADEPATLPNEFRSPPIVWDFTDAHGTRVPDGDYRLYFSATDYQSTSDVTVE